MPVPGFRYWHCWVFVLLLLGSGRGLFAQIAGSSAVEINLAYLPIDVYTSKNCLHSACSPDYKWARYIQACSQDLTVRQCVKDSLAGFKHPPEQNVSGVRFMFAFRGIGFSTPLNPDGTVNSNWRNNLNLFFADMKAAGINNVTPSPRFYGGDYNERLYAEDPCSEGAPYPFRLFEFFPMTPFGNARNDNGVWGLWRAEFSPSYDCSPPDPIFAGWPQLYGVIEAVLGAASSNGLTVSQLDMQNEVNIGSFTVYGRLIYDQSHPRAGQPPESDENVLGEVRALMTKYGFKWERVTLSTGATVRLDTASECDSVYGDSARVIELSALTAALSHQPFGTIAEYQASGLFSCGGHLQADPLPAQLPFNYAASLPQIIDVHSYPCAKRTLFCDACNTNNCQINYDAGHPVECRKCNTDQPDAYQEARRFFQAVRGFLDGYDPTGWGAPSGNVNTMFMLGETISNTTNPSYPNYNCDGPDYEQFPAGAAVNNVLGFNNASPGLYGRYLAGGGATTVFRPWHSLTNTSCYPLVQTLGPYAPSP